MKLSNAELDKILEGGFGSAEREIAKQQIEALLNKRIAEAVKKELVRHIANLSYIDGLLNGESTYVKSELELASKRLAELNNTKVNKKGK